MTLTSLPIDGKPDRAICCARHAIAVLRASSPAGLAHAHRTAARSLEVLGADDEEWASSLAAAMRFGQKLEEERTRAGLAEAAARREASRNPLSI